MPDDQSKIGGAYVELSARIDTLEAGLKEAQSKVDGFASAAQESGKRASRAIDDVGQSFKQSAKESVSSLTAIRQGINAVVGATFGLVGTVASLAAPFFAILRIQEQQVQKAKELSAMYNDIVAKIEDASSGQSSTFQGDADKLKAAMDAIEEALRNPELSDKTDAKVRRIRENLFKQLQDLNTQYVKAQADADEQANKDRQAAADKRQDIEYKAAADRLAAEQDTNAAIERMSMSRIDAINAEYDLRIKRAKEDATNAKNAGDQSGAKVISDRLVLLERARVFAINEEITKQLERQADEMDRAAKAAKQFRIELGNVQIEQQRFQDRQQAGFGLGDIQGSLEDLKTAVRSLSGQIR